MTLRFLPRAEFHRLELIGFSVPDVPPGAGVECLYTGVPTPALVTGVTMGPVEVEVRILDAAPRPPASDWEDVIELAVELGHEATIAGAMQLPGVDTPWFGAEAGNYGMRVSSRGGDANYDLAVEQSSQAIRVELWRASLAPPRALRCRSQRGRERSAVNPALPSGVRVSGVSEGRSEAEHNLVRIAQRHARPRAEQRDPQA